MKRIVLAVVILSAATGVSVAIRSAASRKEETAAEPVIQVEDVYRFYKVYDGAGGHPAPRQLQHDYLDAGSVGLHHLAQLRNVTGVRIAETIAKEPKIYSDTKRCMAVLPRVRLRLQAAFRTLRQLYPKAKFPPVTIAIGRGKPVGVGSPVAGVQIGLEALCSTEWLNPDVQDRTVRVIVHEYAHVQQVRALVDDPHPTVLEGALVEGAAEFTAELIAGGVSNSQLGASAKGREKEVEAAFVADEDKTDLSDWLYNSTREKPRDLGYWVGYRIVKSYYEHQADKRKALREILQMADPKAFVAKSGWYPGIQLQ